MITATCRTSDGLHCVVFDATPWIETADVECLQNLVGAKWGGSIAAWIALIQMESNPDLIDLFRDVIVSLVLGDGKLTFTYQVDAREALTWLREHDPNLYRLMDLELEWAHLP